jgi:hypothetical protein
MIPMVKKSISWNPTEMIPKVKKFTDSDGEKSVTRNCVMMKAWNISDVRKNVYPLKGASVVFIVRSAWCARPAACMDVIRAAVYAAVARIA